jgi:kinetochore protein Spc7/SPC105
MRNLSSPVKATPRSPAKSSLFHQNPSTGLSTPRVVLTPQGRRLSGVGADRPGLGSPRVAEIFDRRESIGEAANNFVPSQPANPRRNVAFADPREMEAEIDKERQDEQEKEDSRKILEREINGSQDDREGTLNLMEMIQGLSPKKSLFRGRKSLHVGSALGLLGKRPAELDDDEDEDSEEPDGVKRLKGHQGSPVKNIRLQSPPSKAETTTGRKTRPSIRPTDIDNVTPTVASSPQRATTPRGQGRFRNFGDNQPTATFDFDPTVPMDETRMEHEDDGERIHLQDFLNMTSIRFMELTTTKRRHTIAPGTSRESAAADGKDDLSLERCVVAGACTVPMLELYQHVSDLSSNSSNRMLTPHSPAAS